MDFVFLIGGALMIVAFVIDYFWKPQYRIPQALLWVAAGLLWMWAGYSSQLSFAFLAMVVLWMYIPVRLRMEGILPPKKGVNIPPWHVNKR